jgi:hypothetical protein
MIGLAARSRIATGWLCLAVALQEKRTPQVIEKAETADLTVTQAHY